jgi:serine/threonine protein kinase
VLCASDQFPFQVKLTDFGLSNFVEEDEVDNSAALLSHVGTSFYLAPEVIGKEGYAFPVDLWACGVVLYIMLCGRFPFWGKTDIEYMKSLNQGPCMVGDGWSEVSDAGKGFLKQLLQLDPKRRLTADEALAHPWVTGESEPEAGMMQKKLSSVAGLANLMSRQRSAKMTDVGNEAANGDNKSSMTDSTTPRGVQGQAQSNRVTSRKESAA